MNNARSRGFTIVEIAVVIGVIAIITSMVAIGFTRVQAQTRDQKRESDIAALRGELEKFYIQNNVYPSSETDTASISNTAASFKFNDSATLSQLRSIFTGINEGFGDPRNDTPANPLARFSGAQDRYFYVGGIVSIASPFTGSGNTPGPQVCTINWNNVSAGGATSYVVGYYSEVNNKWILYSGQRDNKMTTSTGGCSIKSA